MWTAEKMPDLSGKIIIITGANSGLGLESTFALARKGAEVIMACRDPERAEQAHRQVLARVPDAQARLATLDLASLTSVADFATWFQSRYNRLDVLLNNAGVMAIPQAETADGFEMQFGVNHLGHFALTGRLLPQLLATPHSRVVNVSSFAHVAGRMNFADLMNKQRYHKFQAYSQSKLANLLFTLELQHRLDAAKATTLAVSAHPGFALTNLQASLRAGNGRQGGWRNWPLELSSVIFGHTAAKGALSQLYAATAPAVRGGEFYGPRWLMRGHPKRVSAWRHAYDATAAAQLWAHSVTLTGVTYHELAAVPAGAHTV
jgi:protochlorophyllide reductase